MQHTVLSAFVVIFGTCGMQINEFLVWNWALEAHQEPLFLGSRTSRQSSSDVTSSCSHVCYVKIILGCQQSSRRLKTPVATRARAGRLKVFSMRLRRCEEVGGGGRFESGCLSAKVDFIVIFLFFFFSSMSFVPKVWAKNLSSTFGFTEKKCFKGPVCNI